MSDQSPRYGSTNFSGGVSLQTDVLWIHVVNFFGAGGDTINNLNSTDPDDGDPCGYLHFHVTGAGDLTVTGILPPILQEGHGIFFLVKNEADSVGNVIITEEDPASFPYARFDFNGGGPVTIPPNNLQIFIYDPDTKQWQNF